MIGIIFAYDKIAVDAFSPDNLLHIYCVFAPNKRIQQIVNVSSYSIVTESTSNDTGTVTIAGDLEGDYTNSMIEIEGISTPFRITGKSSTQDHISTLTVGDFCSALNGCGGFYDIGTDESPNHLYLNTTFNELLRGTALFPPNTSPTRQYDQGYISRFQSNTCSLFYGTSTTQFDNTIDVRDLVKDGFLETSDLLRYISSIGYKVTIQGTVNGPYNYYGFNMYHNDQERDAHMRDYYDGYFANKVIGVEVEPISMVTIPIFFEDGHSFIESCTINDDIVSRVHMAYGDAYGHHFLGTYFLGLDGQISYEDCGVVGKTDFVEAETLSLAKAAAQEIFDKNSSSHSITFRSDKDLHIGQPVRLMLSSGALDTAIDKVVITSDNNLTQYTCGSLPSNVTEQIKATSWRYGTRVPVNPRKGELLLI